MNENLDIMNELIQQLKAANKIAVIKELYQMEQLSRDDYIRMLHNYMKNN